MKTLNREALAEHWQWILNFTEHRDEIFGHLVDQLLDRQQIDPALTMTDEDRLPHPGYVGKHYQRGGVLFLAMNPGNGGDGLDPAELPHYRHLRALRDAGEHDRLRAFEALMAYDESWYPSIRIMRVIVSPVLEGTPHGYGSMAYMNVLKWRTAVSSGLTPLYRRSMEHHTLEQLKMLDPSVIAVLGVGVRNALFKLPEFYKVYGSRCVTIPRRIGDTSLSPEGRAGIDEVRARLQAHLVTGLLGRLNS